MAKSDRKKYGVLKMPLKATRVLSRPLPHFQDQGINAHALLVIDDDEGTFCSANVYDGNLGKGYDPTEITHPLPTAGDEKWKIWAKRGYEGTDSTFGGVIAFRGADVEAPAVA